MNPITVANNITGLYAACRDCLTFLSSPKTSDKAAALARADFDIQAQTLAAWALYWEIDSTGSEGEGGGDDTPPSPKLFHYLAEFHFRAGAMERALEAIAETLSNETQLFRRYGIAVEDRREVEHTLRRSPTWPSPNRSPLSRRGSDFSSGSASSSGTSDGAATWSTARKIARFRARMAIHAAGRWTVKDRYKMRGLMQVLQEHNDALYRACPDRAYESMAVAFAARGLRGVEDEEGLRGVAGSMGQHLSKAYCAANDSPTQAGYELLQDLAELKARARGGGGVLSPAQREGVLCLDAGDFSPHDPTALATLATNTQTGATVYIEFKSYLSAPGTKDTNLQESILRLGLLLRDSWTPIRFRTLHCSGLFKDASRGLIAFVYALPEGLSGNPPSPTENADFDLRAPESLNRHLHYPPRLPLGARFGLARTLLKALILLHSAGCLHRNIRSSSVLAFKTLDRRGSATGTPRIVVDWAGARLMDYGVAEAEPGSVVGLGVNGAGHGAGHGAGAPAAVLEHEFGPPTSLGGPVSGFPGLGPASPPLAAPSAADIARSQVEARRNAARDVYAHPAVRLRPERDYEAAFDLYALGLVLLEIGLWTPLEELVSRNEKPYMMREYLVKVQVPRLVPVVGQVYADVVRELVSLDAGGGEGMVGRVLRVFGEMGRAGE
ncbi:hypothetical protein EJ06DRAFT_584003 [Trichodelitschia bisporula]|uniref:Protein kinase domain-containing protein n=1 Tax=Trichodelitschia bisporula TaxID=703511 RepID=A0A6G1HQE1_9PEZI|nr:hypothetical protein EJ06DRAFT_584003 [Trichodelitschia bisporula]